MHIEPQDRILAPGPFKPGNLSLQLELRLRRLALLWLLAGLCGIARGLRGLLLGRLRLGRRSFLRPRLVCGNIARGCRARSVRSPVLVIAGTETAVVGTSGGDAIARLLRIQSTVW